MIIHSDMRVFRVAYEFLYLAIIYLVQSKDEINLNANAFEFFALLVRKAASTDNKLSFGGRMVFVGPSENRWESTSMRFESHKALIVGLELSLC
jgi:hypothetical protein